MLIERKSPHSGIVNTMEIDVTEEQLQKWRYGTLIQIAMPALTPDEREFIMTGLTSEDWDAMFGDEE